MNALLRRTPLRVKLVAAVLGLVAVALIAIGAGSTVALRSYLMGRIDEQLADAADKIRQRGVVPESGELPSDYVVFYESPRRLHEWSTAKYQVTAENDLPRPPGNPLSARDLAGPPFTVSAADGSPHWRMFVATVESDSSLIVAESLSDVDSAVGRLIRINVYVGVGLLTVLALVGATVVRRSLRPLTEIERTAAAIGAGDLTQRVPDFEEAGDDEPKTEVGRLARSLNAMLAQIEAAFIARAGSETAALAAEASARDAAIRAQASEARALGSEERMRRFVADASHELRTPLTTIRGFAELYRQGAARSEDETTKLLRRIEDEGARMGLLVEDLLLLARLDRERPIELGAVELPVIAADAVQAAGAIAPDRTVTLEIANDAGPLVVRGDDARLRQVVGNLMTNALAHTPTGTAVAVRLRRDDGYGVLEVADSGPGLSPEQADKVFERFYRADAARTRRTDGPAAGTGLGLAIVAALVAAHDGDVSVDSRLGEGATFRVRLPLVDGAA